MHTKNSERTIIKSSRRKKIIFIFGKEKFVYLYNCVKKIRFIFKVAKMAIGKFVKKKKLKDCAAIDTERRDKPPTTTLSA
jgi:hypothetical protein